MAGLRLNRNITVSKMKHPGLRWPGVFFWVPDESHTSRALPLAPSGEAHGATGPGGGSVAGYVVDQIHL